MFHHIKMVEHIFFPATAGAFYFMCILISQIHTYINISTFKSVLPASVVPSRPDFRVSRSTGTALVGIYSIYLIFFLLMCKKKEFGKKSLILWMIHYSAYNFCCNKAQIMYYTAYFHPAGLNSKSATTC